MAKAKVNHTARTMEWLRKDGWTVAPVERKAPMPAGIVMDKRAHRERMAFFLTVTIDLFGGIDLLAIRGAETLGLQVTSDSGGNHAARRKKIFANPEMRRWLEGGTRRLEVWSWKKVGHRWQPRVEPISLDMLDPEFVRQPVSRGTDGEDW